MRKFATMCGFALSLPALALAEERPLTGNEIGAALTGRAVVGEGTTQKFYESGRTLYNDGHDSWGYWEVRGDQYCSNWPPQGGWACYDMAADPERGEDWLVFIGENGKRYEVRVKP